MGADRCHEIGALCRVRLDLIVVMEALPDNTTFRYTTARGLKRIYYDDDQGLKVPIYPSLALEQLKVMKIIWEFFVTAAVICATLSLVRLADTSLL